MTAPHGDQLGDLLTCSTDGVEENYDRILETVRDRAGVGVTVFFRAMEIDGKPHYDTVRTLGAREADELAEKVDGSPVFGAPTFDLTTPDNDEINAFVYHDVDGDEFDGWPIYETVYRPLQVHSIARIMIYNGGEFVGWLGCYRRGDQPRANRRLCRKLEALIKPVCAAISGLEQLHRDRLPDSEHAAVFTPDGKLDYATPPIREYLDDDTRTTVSDLVKSLDAGELDDCIRVVDGLEVRLSRLEGRGGVRYLANFVPPGVLELNPMSRLTPAQREVATLALRGATNAEIGERTGRSPETVKVHMRNIYECLGVSNRVELVQKLEK